jgi:hypothetical protein
MTIEDEIKELEAAIEDITSKTMALDKARNTLSQHLNKLKSDKLSNDLNIRDGDKLLCIPELYEQFDRPSEKSLAFSMYSKVGDIATLQGRLSEDSCVIEVDHLRGPVSIDMVVAMRKAYLEREGVK